MTLYINLDIRTGKIQVYSKRYGFKKYDYIVDCINFIENNPLGIDYVRFDLCSYGRGFADFCESVNLEYDRYLKINPNTDYEFQEICKNMDNNNIIKFSK